MALMGRDSHLQPDGGPGASIQLGPPSAEDLRLWREFAQASLLIDIPRERLHVHNGRLYLRPKTAAAAGRVHIVRYGLLLGELRRGRFHPAHDLALALNTKDVTSSVSLAAGDRRLAAYMAGEDLPESGVDGWALIAVEGFGLGWGKRVGGRVKNHYPHYLRRKIN